MSEVETSIEERRQSFRLDMEKELVDIIWTDSEGRKREKKIACLDFSKGGLRVDCDHEIELQTDATVIFKAASPNSRKLGGRVIRCVKQDNGWYEIALRLDETTTVIE